MVHPWRAELLFFDLLFEKMWSRRLMMSTLFSQQAEKTSSIDLW